MEWSRLPVLCHPLWCIAALLVSITASFGQGVGINTWQNQADTLYSDDLARAEKAVASYTHKIDSLQSLSLPTGKYRNKLDSLSGILRNKVAMPEAARKTKAKVDNEVGKITGVQDSLTRQLQLRRDALQKKVDQKTAFLDSLSNGLGISRIDRGIPDPVNSLANTQLPQIDLKLPDSNIPGDINLPTNQLPDVKTPDLKVDSNPLSNINEKVGEIQGKPNEILQDNKLAREVGDVRGKVQKVNNAAQKAEVYREEIKDIKDNGLSQADDLTKEAEKQATDQIMKQEAVSELKAQQANITSSKNMLQQYHEMVASMNNTKEAVTTVKDLAARHLDDPFAGQDEKLKAGVAQLDKLKKKYKSIPDSRYLPKRVPNEMKDKPLRERIVPGMHLQVFKSDRTAIDFAPYVAYKLTGRFRPGIGASWRAAVWLKDPWIRKDEVYGYRVFNDFRVYGTFYFRTEGEWLHYSNGAKARYKFPADKDFKDWQFRFNTGLFRTYKISKRLDGQFQVLYNVADLKRFPQNKNTSLRFGLEYKFQPTRGKWTN